MGVKHLQRTLDDAAQGSEHAMKALAALGLSYQRLAGAAPDEQFIAVAEAVSRIQSPTRQAAAAIDVFSMRAGQAMLPTLKLGADGIRKLTDEADRLASRSA